MQFSFLQGDQTQDVIGVVADDVTGACEAAAQFRQAGARVAVLLDSGGTGPLPEGWDVLVLVTGTRHALATHAAQRTGEAVGRLRAVGARRLYVKIDSLLRGSPGGIIEAAAMAFGVPYVLVAPAFPAQGRTVAGGWVRRDDTAVTDAMTRLGETAITSIGHIPLRAIRSSMTAIAISPGLLADSIALLVADSERDEDLWTLARYADSTELPLVAGSAGFARFIADSWCEVAGDDDEDDGAWAERGGPALVVVGARTATVQGQLDCLTGADYAEEVAVVSVAPGEPDIALPALRAALDRVPITVAALDVGTDETVAAADLAAFARVVVAAATERGDALRGLALVGGETVTAVCAAAGVGLLRAVDEVLPGVPCSVIADGLLAGVPIVTKSGDFGGEDALVIACVWLLSDPEYDGDDEDEEEAGDEG